MRGVAALAVLVGHGAAWFAPSPVPRSYLAVDFFFLLSGFVLSRVYEPRFAAGMTAKNFMLQRYIRLYPMFILGLAIGLVSALVLHKGSMSIGAIAVAGIAEMFMLPSPTWYYSPDIFPLNKPGWSLFFELIANALYAFGWRFLSNRALIAIVAVSGIALIALCALGGGYGGAGWANIGWGLPRVCFSFFLGVLIGRRYGDKHVESPFAAVLPAIIIPLLFLPQLAGPAIELALAMLAFPCIVLTGAVVEPRNARIYLLLGAISYPLYAIHEPLLYFCWRILLFFKVTPEHLAPAIGVAFAAMVFMLCLWLERYYDIPVRTYLTSRFVKRNRKMN